MTLLRQVNVILLINITFLLLVMQLKGFGESSVRKVLYPHCVRTVYPGRQPQLHLHLHLSADSTTTDVKTLSEFILLPILTVLQVEELRSGKMLCVHIHY